MTPETEKELLKLLKEINGKLALVNEQLSYLVSNTP